MMRNQERLHLMTTFSFSHGKEQIVVELQFTTCFIFLLKNGRKKYVIYKKSCDDMEDIILAKYIF